METKCFECGIALLPHVQNHVSSCSRESHLLLSLAHMNETGCILDAEELPKAQRRAYLPIKCEQIIAKLYAILRANCAAKESSHAADFCTIIKPSFSIFQRD